MGMEKGLIENCCKTILGDLGIAWSKTDDVPQLTSKTINVLNLMPTNVQTTDQGTDAIKAVVGKVHLFWGW